MFKSEDGMPGVCGLRYLTICLQFTITRASALRQHCRVKVTAKLLSLSKCEFTGKI